MNFFNFWLNFLFCSRRKSGGNSYAEGAFYGGPNSPKYVYAFLGCPQKRREILAAAWKESREEETGKDKGNSRRAMKWLGGGGGGPVMEWAGKKNPPTEERRELQVTVWIVAS